MLVDPSFLHFILDNMEEFRLMEPIFFNNIIYPR